MAGHARCSASSSASTAGASRMAPPALGTCTNVYAALQMKAAWRACEQTARRLWEGPTAARVFNAAH